MTARRVPCVDPSHREGLLDHLRNDHGFRDYEDKRGDGTDDPHDPNWHMETWPLLDLFDRYDAPCNAEGLPVFDLASVLNALSAAPGVPPEAALKRAFGEPWLTRAGQLRSSVEGGDGR